MSHHHKNGGCHDHDNCCSDDKCCDDSQNHHKGDECCHEDFAKHLLCLADSAWMELLKEKIKEEISSSCSEQLEKIAKAVAESNQARWKHKLSLMKTQNEYKDKLKSIFCCCTDSCKS